MELRGVDDLAFHVRVWNGLESIGGAMSFSLYLVGYIILIVGLSIGAHLLKVPPKWIGVGDLCLVGLAIIHGVTATRHKDPPA
jgi:hypothetical protein